MRYTCIIVDDEPLAHEVLSDHISKIPQLELVGKFNDAVAASKYLADQNVDILLLDIKMPEINGLDFLKSLPVKPVSIITTAYRDFAFEGFELGVIDYLLKPISFTRFQIATKRAMDFIRLEKMNYQMDVEKSTSSFEIMIKLGTKKVMVDYRKILFAQGLKDYTILFTDETKYVVLGSIKAFEEYLPHDYFMRVHKSFIIAKALIKAVHKNKIELGSISIPIGRSFKERINAFMKGE